jgi:hypothetical protein
MSRRGGWHRRGGSVLTHADPIEGPKQVGTEGWTPTMTHDHDHDVVVDNRGSGVGAILGVIVIIALIVGIWYFAFGPGQGAFGGTTDQPNDINVNVELPSVAPDAS